MRQPDAQARTWSVDPLSRRSQHYNAHMKRNASRRRATPCLTVVNNPDRGARSVHRGV